jgi:hypothetical protein
MAERFGTDMTGITTQGAEVVRAKALEALISSSPERDFLIVSHPINRTLHYSLTSLLEAKRKNDACTVFLTTGGGDPNGGYRAARCLRHYYKHVRLVVPSFCKSAGTLFAIAADELAIGDLGELGPLDIQVRKGSELQERSSGLDIMQAVQAVTVQTQDAFHRIMVGTRNLGLSTRLCAEFAATVASGIAAPLVSQIDPIRLGEMQRATRVALEYGQRLNEYALNLRDGALETLISAYPAHGFVIDRKEAAQLFHRVSHLTREEKEFCKAFWNHVGFEEENLPPIFIELPPQQGANDGHVANAGADAVGSHQEDFNSADGNPVERGPDGDNPAAAVGPRVRVRPNGRGRGQRAEPAV